MDLLKRLLVVLIVLGVLAAGGYGAYRAYNAVIQDSQNSMFPQVSHVEAIGAGAFVVVGTFGVASLLLAALVGKGSGGGYYFPPYYMYMYPYMSMRYAFTPFGFVL